MTSHHTITDPCGTHHIPNGEHHDVDSGCWCDPTPHINHRTDEWVFVHHRHA